MNRGEVWWAEDPDIGRRPVCIMTRSHAIPALNRVLVVPATRRVRGIPTEVVLGRDDGMPAECALALDNLRPVQKILLFERITQLSQARMGEVCRALAIATGCG